MIMFTPWLLSPHAENDDNKVCTFGYEALTPTELEPEKASSYVGALNYAYEQPDIRNIAVTGPYGAGKSSVLKTWCKTKDRTLRVLTVSLADFDMQKYADDSNTSNVEGNAGEEKKTPNSIEKSIEYSILQQILYKNKKHELPHSRIDRISSVTAGQILQSAAVLTGTILLTGIALFFLAPDYVTAKLSLPEIFSRYLLERPFAVRLVGATISMVGSLGLLLSQLHRIGIFDRKVSLDKVDLLKGAVTARASSPSLLNVYIDEIVYFFDSTKYDVVIFEDLDRFNNGRIFIKLREINQIINNCLSDRKPIKFIYAVRDGIFNSAESRTKFFDFVMPVIPIMDNQNASEHFSNKFKDEEKNEPGLSECIARIATFIPNMRVMHNITNEFRLYQNIVNNRENLTKLLAMIAYKNLCAEDYHGIDSKKGILYNFIKSYIENDIQSNILLSINNELEESLHLLEIIKKEKNTERKNLRRELLEPYINEKHKNLIVFQAGGRLTLEEATEDEDSFFKILDEREISTILVNQNQYFLRTSGNETKRLRTEYEERCPLIDGKSDSHLKEINNKILTLETLKRKVLSETVSEITIRFTNERFIEWIKTQSDAGVISTPDDHEQNNFIFFLLSNGYLSTDYMSYRSIFMAGGLSESDNSFLKAVMAGKDPEKTFSFHLDKVKNVIDRLRKLGVLQRENAQHPAVTTWLLEHDTLTLKKNIEILLVITDGERSLTLLDIIQKDWPLEQRLRYLTLFISHEDLLVKLVTLLCEYTHLAIVQEITACLCSLQTFGTQLKKWVNVHLVKKLFNNQKDLLSNLPTGYSDIFVDNIHAMNIHLPHIPLASNEEQRECIQNVVSQGLFTYSDINIENICRSLTRDTNISREEFLSHPLKLIESLQIPALDAVLQTNMGTFISSIFSKSEETDRVPSMLNSKYVSLEAAEIVISRMAFKIEDVRLISNRKKISENKNNESNCNIYSLLIQCDRLAANFSNLIYLLHDEAVDIGTELVTWVNDKYRELGSYNFIISSIKVLDNFIVKFIGSHLLHEEALLTVMKAFNISITQIPKTIPLRNAELLCAENKLAPTINVLTGLYNALNGEVNHAHRINVLLCNLIAQRPALLLEEPEEIFYVGNDFDIDLAREILNHHKISINIRISTLTWLKSNDPDLLNSISLLSLQTLVELSPWMLKDELRLPLLRAILISGEGDTDNLRVILNNFADDNYHGLLPLERFRKLPYTANLWEMAELLSEAGFIHPPKMGSGRDEHKIVIKPIRHHYE